MFNMSYYADWRRGIRNRNYFVLHELLQRDEVDQIIAIDYLPITLRQKIRVLSNRIKHHELGINDSIKKVNHKLSVCSIINVKSLHNLLAKLHTSNCQLPTARRVLWSYYPLHIDYFNSIDADLKIFDAVDDWRAHPAYADKRALLDQNYQQILEQADLIFAVSENLRQNLFKSDPKVFWVPNGADLKIKKFKIQNFNSKFKIVIGYVGTIQSRVDFELMRHVALAHPDKEFVFVGPVWNDAPDQIVRDLPNVKFVGRVPYDELPKYLASFDAAIIPHKIDDLTRSMDPMKFYEYCAFGLPVISTQRLSDDPALVYYTKSQTEFSQAIDRAIAADNPELKNRRRAFAEQNSWSVRITQMLSVINDELKIKN